MTDTEKLKVVQEVTNLLAMRLKLEGEDFFALPKLTRNLLIISFQVGVEYWQGKVEEVKGKTLEELDIEDTAF